MAFVRPYKPSDSEAAAHICRATLPPSLASSEPARRLAPYIWTHQYTRLSPTTCFVLDDGSGTAVGYCIGCPDTVAFCAGYDAYVTSVLEASPEVGPRPDNMTSKEPWTTKTGDDGGKETINETCLLQTAYSARWLLQEGNEDVTRAGFMATMHIDLLPAWQGKGWGRVLLESLVQSLRQSREEGRGDCGRGVWLGVSADNKGAIRFYEKMQFRVLEREGAEKKGVCMVREI